MVYSVIVNLDHLLYKINELADFSFVNREMKQFYHERRGRIAVEPEILARSMVAQYLYNWSDRTYVDMVENHITTEWFVGLGVEQKSFDFTILSKSRKHFKAAAGYNATDAYKEDVKTRAHVERKQWEMKHPHGLGRVKYRGLERVDQQAANTAVVVNLKRWAGLHNGNARPNASENEKCAKLANI